MRFIHVNLTTLKKYILMLNEDEKTFFLQKWSNLHERTAICWLKREFKFQIFSDFCFLRYSGNTVEKNSLVNCRKNWGLVGTASHSRLKASAKLFRLESPIPKHLGAEPPVRGTRGRSSPQNNNHIFFFWEKKILFQIFNFFFSKLFKFTWKIQNRLNRKKN